MISRFAVVEAEGIPEDTSVMEFAVIRAGAILGHRVMVHPHVVVGPGVTIEDDTEVFPGAVLGKEPTAAQALARQPVFHDVTRVGPGCSIGPHAVVYRDVIIGQGTLIGDAASVREQTRIGSQVVVGRHVTINYNVSVGARTKIMDHSWLAGNMVVEEDVFIGGGVMTANDNALGRGGYGAEEMCGPTFRRYCAIGIGAAVLPGVIVGEGAVVGAQAVVTKDVQPFTLVMGVPARVVRELEHVR